MLVGRDLGLPNLVVLFVVFPAIGFLIRRKWRHAKARREEIKRLLIFASEEAARAEIEGYFYTSNVSSSVSSPDSAWVPVPPTASVPVLKPPYKCAVCFSPTNTRCAKCKAARYWQTGLFLLSMGVTHGDGYPRGLPPSRPVVRWILKAEKY
ncbi:hypothetical protein L1987_43279 [Smallanthus sonchifolius]|uniref:Uncharacterized protein n=1 Tax=Smallanthus sonchifolius TaxID=185202 RepID=A0ACB9GL48_9ASTR|nr:hypothetical protein L1987_43279 [Smallanthus sonchifolius]